MVGTHQREDLTVEIACQSSADQLVNGISSKPVLLLKHIPANASIVLFGAEQAVQKDYRTAAGFLLFRSEDLEGQVRPENARSRECAGAGDAA